MIILPMTHRLLLFGEKNDVCFLQVSTLPHYWPADVHSICSESVLGEDLTKAEVLLLKSRAVIFRAINDGFA